MEIKNRVNRLFNTVRDYEKVQCYAYMHVLDIPYIDLAETLKSDNSVMNINALRFENEFWNIIEKAIESFVDTFYDFLDDESIQDELLKA